jgi:DNA recombination protein RmuC
MPRMNPASSSLFVLLALALLVALIAGLVLGLVLARSRTQAQVDAALAQEGHAAQVELAQMRERLRAGEQETAAVRSELERTRAEGQGWRRELDASRDERARLTERASRVAPLEAEVAQLAQTVRGAGEQALKLSASEAQKSQLVASLGARVAALEDEARAAAAELQARSTALRTTAEELAQLRSRADAERESAQEKLALLADAKVALSDQFKTLASDILEEKSKRFAEQNQVNLGTLLDPLRTQLSEFKGKVEEVYVQEGKDRSALSEQVRQLMELNQTLSRDANNLTKALKGSAKTQGNWGELILERVLEASGLRKGHEYHVQDSQRTEDGKLLQPDVVLHLPEERRLVVDAKVSLVAYDRYIGAETDDDRAAAVRLHLESVRAHVRGLSVKRYQDLYGLKSLDMVVMFVPIEPAFMLAVTHDDALFMDAWQRNVLLVSPSTLLFVVRTIANLWRQEAQTRNAQDIAKRGAELYDKLAAFVADLQKVGAKLKDAQSAYDEAEKKLSAGKGNVIRQAEMLKGLGLKTAKALPTALVEAASDGEPVSAAAAAAAEPASLPLFDAPDEAA